MIKEFTYINLIDQTLHELLPQNELLLQAAHYSLEGGKRLRPLLMLAVLEMFAIPLEKGLYPACALEMIHTYSLIHDDLPCMDDDDWRRGKPTLHKKYSEALAVLTGDFLLTYSFEVLAKAPLLTTQEKEALIATLALQSGREGMLGGQLLDLSSKVDPLALDAQLAMYYKKTGALFTAALEFGAILANATLQPFRDLGYYLGIAFQIQDDLLDQDGVVLLLGLEKAQLLCHQYYEKTLSIFSSFSKKAPLFEYLLHKMTSKVS